MADAAMGDLGDVHQPVQAGHDLHERAERGEPGDGALDLVAHLGLGGEGLHRLGGFALQQGAAGDHDVAAVLFQFGDQEFQ